MRYGSLFLIDDLSVTSSARRLEPVPLGSNKSSSGYDELWLQRLLASHPQALPIGEIEAFLEGAVPICLELGTKAGPIDLLLVTPRGDIVLVECKLWRNPAARREVVGQIIDYAKELPRLSYEAFEAAIHKAEPAGTSIKTHTLYQRAGAEAAGVDEASFVNAVSRNLRRGRFLLLIVGDGIQEGVETIADFLQQHAGMHFTLALVEVAIFRSYPNGYVVQPRVLAKTEMVPRGVVFLDDDRIAVRADYSAGQAGEPSGRQPSVAATISEARLFETLDAKLPGASARLRPLIAALEERGADPRFNPTEIVLQGAAAGRTLTLGKIAVQFATVWFDTMSGEATRLGVRDPALAYYRAVASLVRDEAIRKAKFDPTGSTGTASLPLDDLLVRWEEWLVAIDKYLEVVGNAMAAPI